MSVSLSDLVTRLQQFVPARNSVPITAQYEWAVKDAIGDYGRRAPMRKEIDLSIVSGTAAYTLPDDFLSVVALQSLANGSGVVLGDQGIIPVSADFSERYGIQGLTITFYPMPEYTAARTLWYMARHTLDNSNNYPYMTDDEASIALLRAQATALTIQANVAAQEAWQYAIGDESVNKTSLSKALRDQAADLNAQYAEAVKRLPGGRAYGTRAKYTTGVVDAD